MFTEDDIAHLLAIGQQQRAELMGDETQAAFPSLADGPGASMPAAEDHPEREAVLEEGASGSL